MKKLLVLAVLGALTMAADAKPNHDLPPEAHRFYNPQPIGPELEPWWLQWLSWF